ncbi:pectate lyase-like [Silene latifolia]|uniref:pectate lyase-like n=1 Tax=Silene latifolia TaxID=37657 RepID=UPI003D77D79B
MESINNDVKLRLLSLIIFSCILVGEANIGHFDDHWLRRQEAAKKAANASYDPNPHNVTNHLNRQVHKALNESDEASTRRGLFGSLYKGECLAANPIDRCWRCDPNWAQNRQKLADCVLGFGHKVRGGQGGEIYVVTDNTDTDLVNPKPGTLRHAVIQKEPLWIIFKHGMVIRLSEELMISANKTIDGRGGHVHIAGGAGLTVQFVDNVIIHNIHVHDINPGGGGMIRDSIEHYGFRTRSDGDGISLYGATNVWIDHVSMSNCADGLIDAIEMSTAITISNCHFTDHNDVMLFGAKDERSEDKIQQITLAFNHFGKRLIQRMPRCRWGFFHVVNNDYTHWEMYAIGGSQNPTIICQGNRFIAPPNPFAKEVTKRDFAPDYEWKTWLWVSENDVMINGAYFRGSGDKSKMASFTKQDMISAKPGTYVRRLTRFSGALLCKEGSPC